MADNLQFTIYNNLFAFPFEIRLQEIYIYIFLLQEATFKSKITWTKTLAYTSEELKTLLTADELNM